VNNVVAIGKCDSKIETLSLKEDEIVKRAYRKYNKLDPREKFKDFFVDEKRGTRRFITGFFFVNYKDLVLNQVASEDFSKKRCLEHLLPIFEKEGMLYPVFVSPSTLGAPNWNLETGAHRAWTENHRGNQIAAYQVSPAYDMETGEIKDSPLALRRARIKANPQATNRPYTMQDVADQCKRALEDDPYYEGRNPSGEMPPLKAKPGEFSFGDLVDDLYGTEIYPAPTIRGKIYKMATNGTKAQMLLTLDFNRVNTDFLSLGWSTGLSSNKKARVPFVDHLDGENSSLILETDSNGANFEAKLFSFIKKYTLDEDYRCVLAQNSIKYIKVYAKIYKPDSDIAKLQNNRNKFLSEIKNCKQLLERLGLPIKIDQVYFPKQLDISQDQGESFFLT
jgi:hypothetical protein